MGTKIVYNHKSIEKKWREKWEEKPVNPRVDENGNKKQKYYCLDMFPYPSGNGLHVGHWRGYVISDVWSRYKLQQGYYIVHPMGWDAFGLPAENYAIKMGVHPAKSTAANVANIKRQINDIAALYDWDMEVNTTDPEFYNTKRSFRSTGVLPVRQDLQMKRLSMVNASVVVQRLQRRTFVSGCSVLPSMQTVC